MKTTLFCLTMSILACSDPAVVPSARFANTPPVTVVDDRHNIPAPRPHETLTLLYHFDGSVTDRLTEPLELEVHPRAEGVNALDEVPDSTWFTNRIGARDLTLDELRIGPNAVGSPESHTPWTVLRGKALGEAPGLFVRDARGEEFLIKFDREGYPETETATHIITGRILWACGYNVPDDYIARVKPDQLVLAKDAYYYNQLHEKKPLKATDLSKMLAHVVHESSGSVRVLASRSLPGKAIGGHTGEGRRRDDPNDRIPHELRRDLRGARAIFAWLDHADVKENNSLDVWVTDPTTPVSHYVMHYFLDFGKALGGLAYLNHDMRRGVEYTVDFAPVWGSFITLGLRPRPFESRSAPQYRGIGMYDVHSYDPAQWRPETPAYTPFLRADRIDWFWAAKIMMRFSREQLRAIVDVGQLSDPRAVDYLTDTLVARQRATAIYAFSRVSPLDHFTLGQNQAVCFDDLMLTYGFTLRESTYRVRTFDRKAHPLAAPRAYVSPRGGHSCTGPLAVANSSDGYTIVRIDTRRGNSSHAVFVHIAREPLENSWHVIGIYRG